MKKKTGRIILWSVVGVLIAGVTIFAWPRVPIITALAAKGMCSSVFLAEKEPANVEAEDLSFFPVSLAKSVVNYEEKSVTSKVFGLAPRKAIYREGLGAVIVLETPEEELSEMSFNIPDPGYSQDTIPWPMGDLLSEERINGVNYNRLNELIDTCFDNSEADPFKKTLGIAVVYNNQLIAEKYLGEYDQWTKFHGWSMTKSVTGTLAGILVDEGVLNLNEPTGFDEWQNDDRKTITLDHVIRMSSGLDWFENYFTISDATIMLMRSDDMLGTVLQSKLTHEPGTFYNYSGGDANLVSGIIRKAMKDDELYHGLVYNKLFHRIGMLNTVVETDARGLFVASSYSYGSTRDWARFGLLFLNEGVFEGDTILSKQWVNYMKTAAPASNGTYAGTFWLKEPSPENDLADIPEDVFFADGFLGQRVYIIPSKKLVAVRMGYSLSNFSVNDFLREVIACLPE
ncbi:serine hydrolase domain-containing protein [Bacteroidota bacterium]